MKPRFLPEIQPTQVNYSVDILGKWRGAQYRFIQRYLFRLPGQSRRRVLTRRSPASIGSAATASTSSGIDTPVNGGDSIAA
jgi:hypothetical protein